MLRNNLLSKFPLSGITLKELNATMVKKKELSQVMKEVFHSYDTLAHIIEKDPTIADNIRVKILGLLSSLKDFDDIYLGIAMTRREQLEKALNNIRKMEILKILKKT